MNRLLTQVRGGVARVPARWVEAGVPKIVHVDRVKVQHGLPAVTLRCPYGMVRCSGLRLTGSVLVGQWERRAFPGGPSSWIETRAALELFDPEMVKVVPGGGLPGLDWSSVGLELGDR